MEDTVQGQARGWTQAEPLLGLCFRRAQVFRVPISSIIKADHRPHDFLNIQLSGPRANVETLKVNKRSRSRAGISVKQA